MTMRGALSIPASPRSFTDTAATMKTPSATASGVIPTLGSPSPSVARWYDLTAAEQVTVAGPRSGHASKPIRSWSC